MKGTLKSIADNVGAHFSSEASRLGQESLAVKVLLIVGGGLAAGVAQFLEKTTNFNPAWLGIGGVLCMGLGGLYSTFREKSNPEVLENARQALEAARELSAERLVVKQVEDDLRDKARRMSHLHLAQSSMREAAEHCFSISPSDEARAAVAVLAAADTSIRAAIDFQMDEEWTVSIYRAEASDKGELQLRCVAADRFDQRGASETRVWPLGVGHTGATFANGEETVVPDLSAMELGTLDRLPPDKRHATDGGRYKSIAAVPVRVARDARPWGVVVATSDRASRFTLDHDEKGSLSAEVVRALAGMVALAVASQRAPR